MFSQIAFFPILGKPLIMWGGLSSLLVMLLAVAVPTLQKRWPKYFNYRTHVVLARIAVALALLHGGLGLLTFL
jgi:cytochrome b561